MKCRSCGEEIREDARFCGFCGAAQTWWSTSLPEEERKAAYALLAAYGCKSPEQMEDLVERYHRAQSRLPENQKHLEDLNKTYRAAKRAQGCLDNLYADCQACNMAAREAAREHPELEALVHQADQRRTAGGNDHQQEQTQNKE